MSRFPLGLKHTLVWRGQFRFLERPFDQCTARLQSTCTLENPMDFVASGQLALEGRFGLEGFVDEADVTGHARLDLRARRLVVNGSFQGPEGRPLELQCLHPWNVTAPGTLHCRLLDNDEVVASGTLSTDLSDFLQSFQTLRTIRR